MRVVLDTNVLLSSTWAKAGQLLLIREAWQAGHFSVLVSEPLLKEVESVMAYPKLAKLLTEERRAGLLHRLERLTEPVVCREPYPKSPDPADDFLLAMLRDGEADLLVTGDRALLALESF